VLIRTYRPGDEAALLACYNQVFPTADGRIAPRSLHHWQWKFRDNPTGRIQITLGECRADGSVVSTYAGIPVAIWAEGVRTLAAQSVDLVVLPRWRRHGGRPGLFAQTGRLWMDTFLGEERGQNLFTYGWPVPAWRAGQRYLGYLNIRDWDLLFREAGPGSAPRLSPGDLEVRDVARFGADVDALWERMSGELRLALVRDARYLNWRYATHPDLRYGLYECRERSSGALRGLCVYTRSDWLRPRTGYIVDWLVPAADADATVALLVRCETQAAADGAHVLATLFNQVDPRFLAFQRLGFMVLGTSYFVVVATTRLDTVFYRENWFLTLGDSDLV
jgi:hypothetical protein